MADDDWRGYRRLVVSELKRHDKWLQSHEERLGDLRTDLKVLQARAAMWGAGAGLILGTIAALAIKALGG